jgi:hypothetical protein
MLEKPSREHQFFDDMVGEWTMEHSCVTAPDQSPEVIQGKAIGRTYGGLWLIIECQGESDQMGPWISQFTLGYDPQNQRYHGTFVASMMTFLWLYQGQVDSSGKRLVLDAQGPRMEGEGMANYQDIFEIVDHDHWILRSQIQADDGSWTQFMEGHHRRIA